MASAADLYELLRKIRYDLTAAQGKLTDAFSLLAELKIADVPVLHCVTCGLPFKGPRTYAEHVYSSHGGPLPGHWAELDELVAHAEAEFVVEGEPDA